MLWGPPEPQGSPAAEGGEELEGENTGRREQVVTCLEQRPVISPEPRVNSWRQGAIDFLSFYFLFFLFLFFFLGSIFGGSHPILTGLLPLLGRGMG